jgi:uncharacterized protein (TIGR02246 family)
MNNLARDYAIAWTSRDPDAVASFFASDGQASINQGELLQGRAAIANMVRGVCSEFPDLDVRCDMMRWAGHNAIFVWTREGHHGQSGNRVVTRGWDSWELNPEGKIHTLQGWFDADELQRQIDGR